MGTQVHEARFDRRAGAKPVVRREESKLVLKEPVEGDLPTQQGRWLVGSRHQGAWTLTSKGGGARPPLAVCPGREAVPQVAGCF